MPEDLDSMRGFMVLAESLVMDEHQMPSEEPEIAITPKMEGVAILDELRTLVSKLRAHMENGEGDLATGVEMGMQRAADMIERVIRSYED